MPSSVGEFAYARSGDKGNNANIGVACRRPEDYPILLEVLTEKVVAEYFVDLHPSAVERFELPNLAAVNFVLHNVLDGGAARSLRMDPQGKTLGESMMMMSLNEVTDSDDEVSDARSRESENA
jgi:hypothetical protein